MFTLKSERKGLVLAEDVVELAGVRIIEVTRGWRDPRVEARIQLLCQFTPTLEMSDLVTFADPRIGLKGYGSVEGFMHNIEMLFTKVDVKVYDLSNVASIDENDT